MVEATEQGESYVTPNALLQVVGSLGSAVDAALGKALTRVQDISTKRELPLREQSDILVWLMRGRSTALAAEWSELARADAAVAAAMELNTLSRFDVGREDADALIEFKVASADKKAKPNAERLSALLGGVGDLDDFTPVRLTIAERRLTNEFDATELGVHLHDELNLARLLDGS